MVDFHLVSSPEYILDLPMGSRPRITSGGVPTHGQVRREQYRLPRVWCLHAYRYHAGLIVDNHPLEIHPGCVGLIPPGVDIVFQFRRYPSVHAYLHFELPEVGERVRIPAMQNLLLDFDRYFTAVEAVVAGMAGNGLRAEVRLWDLLWELADRHAASQAQAESGPGLMDTAIGAIELRLGEDLRVETLAESLGVSHNHLTRLFRQHTGMTVIGYIRHRRTQRARHLLTHSTRPIKAIAAEVGVPNLQQFNKLMRQELGRSPREVRG